MLKPQCRSHANKNSFEYSATFSQAVAAATSEQKKKLTSEYAKAILFDYSYRARHLAYLNWDEIFFELVEFKNDRAWFNLDVSKETLQRLLFDGSWYNLKISPQQLEVGTFERVKLWQETATTLLKQYVDAFYKANKAEWEAPKLVYDIGCHRAAEDAEMIAEQI